jgi:hypothetical protein
MPRKRPPKPLEAETDDSLKGRNAILAASKAWRKMGEPLGDAEGAAMVDAEILRWEAIGREYVAEARLPRSAIVTALKLVTGHILTEDGEALPREEIEARLKVLLTRSDATTAPDPREWAAGRKIPTALLQVGVFWVLGAEKWKKLERQREKRRKGLSDRVTIPGAVVTSLARPQELAARASKLAQGDLFPGTAMAADILRAAVETIEHRLPWQKMGPVGARCLLGLFRLSYREANDNLPERLEVPAALLYRAAGYDNPTGPQRRRVFEAIHRLADLKLPLTHVTTTADGTELVDAWDVPILAVHSQWRDVNDRRRNVSKNSGRAVAREYREWDRLAAWEGPLPDQYTITLPAPVRSLTRRLVLEVEAFERIERAAREVRGEKGPDAIEWALLLYVTQQGQPKLTGHDGTRYLVDRDAFLSFYYGTDAVRRAKAKGKRTYTEQYEKAIRVLEVAKVADRAPDQYETKRGQQRDLFTLSAGVLWTPQETEPGAENV